MTIYLSEIGPLTKISIRYKTCIEMHCISCLNIAAQIIVCLHMSTLSSVSDAVSDAMD